MGVIWLSLFAVISGVSAYGVAVYALRQGRGWPRFLATAVVAWGWFTIGLQVVGSLGFLTRPALFFWACLGGIAGLNLRLRRAGLGLPNGTAGRGLPYKKTSSQRTSEDASEPVASTSWDIPSSVAVALLIVTVSFLIAPSLLMPPRVVSDGPIYHLYYAAKWWKAGRIFLVPTPFGETAAPYFPAGGDLLYAGLMTLFGGDRPARVGQSPFLLMGFLATIATARRLRAKLPSALIASAWAATSLPLIVFGFEANVDAIFVAGYLTAVYFGLRYALDGAKVTDLALAALAAGLGGATKPTSVLFVPPLLALGGTIVLWRTIASRTKARDLGVMIVAAILPSGFWYVRNALLTGNPFYPLHVEALGRVWLRGWFPSSAMTKSPYYIDIRDWRAFATIVLVVVDPRLAPAWAASLVGAWRWGRAKTPLDRWVWAVSILAILNVATYWLLIPYRSQQRFMLQALGLAAIPLARLLDRGPWARWLGVALLAVHLLTGASWPFDRPGARPFWAVSDKVPASSAALVSFPVARLPWSRIASEPEAMAYLASIAWLVVSASVTAWLWGRAARTGSSRKRSVAIAATLASVGVYLAAFELMTGARRMVFPVYPEYQNGWAAVDRVSPARGLRVAYAGTNLPFYLMAGGLRNGVYYVPVDAHPDWLLHDYHLSAVDRGDPPLWDSPRPGWDRIHPDYASWLKNLDALRIDLLVVARCVPEEGPFNVADREQFPIERVWADRHPEVFERVSPKSETGERMRVYRLRKDR